MLALHFAGLLVYNGKSFIAKSWNIVKSLGTDTWVMGYDWLFAGEKQYPI